MDFGTAIHSACEEFLKTRIMDSNVFVLKLKDLWALNGHTNQQTYSEKSLETFMNEGFAILKELPTWFEETFPNWKFVDAEHYLYEKIENHPNAFKGFIDCIISTDGKKGIEYWVIDFKTTSWGWQMQKKTDEMVKAQLVLYKNYWSKKTGTDTKNVKCGFVLLKRTAKPGAHCELVAITVGEPITERSLKVVNNMVVSVKRGTAIKNRYSCTYCDYRDTEHCVLGEQKIQNARLRYNHTQASMTQKKKILMMCDHPLATSGVATQARYLINGLVATGRYSFKCFGGAMHHENMDVIKVNEDFIIKPTIGFGDKNSLRLFLAQEKPDAILLFTDPRFFTWVWEIEDEVHQVCPIAYNHLWDNPPVPTFNKVLYDSTDLINCINYPTYEMVSGMFPEKTNYVPHAIPPEVFYRMKDEDVKSWKMQLLGQNRADHFIVTYVSRNARRKMPSDVILSFKQFLDRLEVKTGKRNATLLMHTDPLDVEGPNLHQVIDTFGVIDNVVFSKERLGFAEMNTIYNISDVVINRSCNEGFGLSILEAKMTETPCVAIKTGGLTRQIEDHETGEQYGVALNPDVRSLVGNQAIPFIYEDFVSHESVTNALETVFDWGEEKRREVGKRSRAHALKNYNIEGLIGTWDKSLTQLIDGWKENKPKRWEMIEL